MLLNNLGPGSCIYILWLDFKQEVLGRINNLFSQSQNYFTTFTAKHFVLAPSPYRPTTRIFTFQLNICDYSPYVTSSLARGWACRLQLLLGFASAVILSYVSRRTHDNILLSQIRDSPNLEGQIPVFISPRNRVIQLYPQALCSHFVASYDSQGCGGSIRPRLHTGLRSEVLTPVGYNSVWSVESQPAFRRNI
jgi:hypothetical protein